MKEISVLEPVFYSEFRCTGGECREHCCKGWNIVLDKPTVNHYLNSSDAEIRAIAKTNIIKTKKSYADWGKISFSQKDHCAFMDEARLCSIHKKLGAAALSPTCANYPRMQKATRYEIKQTLTLSCPEAAKKLLLNSNAMLLREKKELRARELNAPELNEEGRLINLMCTNILFGCGSHTQQGLYGIAMLFLYLEKLENNEEKYAKAEEYFASVLHSVENGEVQQLIDKIKPDYQLQWRLLLRLLNYLRNKKSVRGKATLQRYVDNLYSILSDIADDGRVNLPMQRLDNAWKEKVAPWLAERPHIMRNYLQYRMYNDGFPAIKTHSSLANLYLLTAEWFLLKSLVSSCVAQDGNITEDDVINIIYSFHTLTKHDRISDKAFLDEIDKTKVNDDISLIYLLT